MKTKKTLFIAGFLLTLLSLSAVLSKIDRKTIFQNYAQTEFNDFTPDKIFGQPDYTEIEPNQITANRVFHPQGVLVDRGISPNRVYIWDSGNSRILGYSSLGVCNGGTNNNQPCVNNKDCPEGICSINETKNADLVIGQPNFIKGTCNGNSILLSNPTAGTLCSQNHPYTVSLMESPEPNQMAVDVNHNLYVFEKYNNRVLRFNDPFNTDVVADFVWGQSDFVSRGKNRTGLDSVGKCWGATANIGNNTLDGGCSMGVGLDIDPQGNLWVADTGNYRVLRFPFNSSLGRPAETADVVIGQPDFTSFICQGPEKFNPCIIKNQNADFLAGRILSSPNSVRYNYHTNQLLVVDWPCSECLFRILIYNPPFSNFMPAEEIILSDVEAGTYPLYIHRPAGIEIDPNDSSGFWVNTTKEDANSDKGAALFLKKQEGQWIIAKKTDGVTHPAGGIGVDSEGNIFLSFPF